MTDKTYRERVDDLGYTWDVICNSDCRDIASEADAEIASLRARIAELELALRQLFDAYTAPATAEQPAEPVAQCRDDGRCQYAIDHGAEGMGHCSPKCVMPRTAAATAPAPVDPDYDPDYDPDESALLRAAREVISESHLPRDCGDDFHKVPSALWLKLQWEVMGRLRELARQACMPTAPAPVAPTVQPSNLMRSREEGESFDSYVAAMGWRPAPVAPDEVVRHYGACSIQGPVEDVSFILRHLPDVDAGDVNTITGPQLDALLLDAIGFEPDGLRIVNRDDLHHIIRAAIAFANKRG